jgi:hypothetical protein
VVGGESTRQHTDVAKGGLQRFVENVTDLVLKILSSNKRIEQVLPALAQHGVDFTTGTSQVLVVVESFPEREKRLWTRLGTGIKKNADFWVKDTAESGKEPTMRVDFLAVLLLQAEHHLDRW